MPITGKSPAPKLAPKPVGESDKPGKADKAGKAKLEKAPDKLDAPGSGAEVVSLDAFRKKS